MCVKNGEGCVVLSTLNSNVYHFVTEYNNKVLLRTKSFTQVNHLNEKERHLL